MLCPLCQHQIQEDSKFCERCGKKVPRCPTCGKVIRERIRFCDVDGTPIPEELVASFGSPVRPQPRPVAPIATPVQSPPAAAPAPEPKAPAAQPTMQAPVRRQFCIKCGKPCRAGQDLCDSCMPQPQPEPEQESEAAPIVKEKKRGKPLIIFLLVVILAAALVAAYSLLGNNDDDDDSGEKSSISEDKGGEDSEDVPAVGDNSQAVEATRAPEPSETATEPTEKEIKYEYRYEVIKSDMSWTEAKAACEAKGGYLATINSQEEYETICKLADKSGLTYLWLGASLPSENADWANTGWIDGEAWTFENWYPGEPSKVDADGTKELYLCMWDAKYEGREIGWTFNDQRNDIVSAFPSVSGIVGYVCEYKVEVSG